MASVSDLAVGKCFVTASKQMRKVVDYANGEVTYESWSANQERPATPSRVKVNDAKFCADVDRAVPCHHREGFGG